MLRSVIINRNWGISALGALLATVACSNEVTPSNEAISSSALALSSPEQAPSPEQSPIAEAKLTSEAAAAVAALQQVEPTARVRTRANRITRVFGKNLATGADASKAAEAFRERYASSLGSKPADLRLIGPADGTSTAASSAAAKAAPLGLMYDASTGQYKYWLYRYEQVSNGVPVHDARLLTLVKNDASNAVVWSATTLRDIGSFQAPAQKPAMKIDPSKSKQAASARAPAVSTAAAIPSNLTQFTAPELVIYAGKGDEVAAPRLAMKYVGSSEDQSESWLFIAQVDSGDVLLAENLTHFANVPGTVRGNVTSGNAAAECEAELPVDLPDAEVAIAGGSSGFTSAIGYFYLTNPGTSPVSVNSTLKGRYFDVVNWGGADESLTLSVTPPNAANFTQNAANNQETVRAQVNAYYAANQVRSYLLNYLPGYPSIPGETDIAVRANRNDLYCPGNAWYSWGDHSINFCVSGVNWEGFLHSNSAFSSVVHHEYGHHIVNRAGNLTGYQGEYGEAMGDILGLLISDRPEHARGFRMNQCSFAGRTADNACLYNANCSSCGDFSNFHDCGQLLSGCIWDMRNNLQVTSPGNYRAILSALTLSSIPMHTGTGIDGDIAVDLLSLDDNDGDISNGTPHSTEICNAFARHNIACPSITPPGPCASFCPSATPMSWSGSYQSGALGTGPVCRTTTQRVAGGNCGNFTGGRALYVNGTPMTCNSANWASVPAAVNGGYCISASAGNYAWAFFTLW